MKRALVALLLAASVPAEGPMGSRPFVASASSPSRAGADTPVVDELRAFAALEPIDTHAHVFKNDPAFRGMLETLHLHLLNICVVNDAEAYSKTLQPKLRDALAVVRASHGHAALCTTFDLYQFNDPGFTEHAIQQLNENFAQGAVAVKIWKNIGMELKNSSGRFVMPDDPALAPIYKDIAAHNKTLIAHLAEPTSCWQPLTPASPDYEYYRDHPEWYMYKHPDHPSKETILAARNHLLAENPKLRVVGAHLGSMEVDVDEIARRFDRYPNFAVDTAARIPYLMMQPREKVRAFLIKYQDRVLYGTDLGLRPNQDTDGALREWKDAYAGDWKFFATDERLEYRGQEIRGLKLTGTVLHKLYHDNAVRWIPGILGAGSNALESGESLRAR